MPPTASAPHILLVEDSPDVVALLERVLTGEGYVVHATADGDAGLAAALAGTADLMIVDVGLPGRDGIAVTETLRRRGVATPVLMLTARTAVHDRITGLDAGADDYLAKPFEPSELLARVRALLRRTQDQGRGAVLHVGDLALDPVERTARRAGRELALTQREFALLECLMRHAGRPVSRQTIAREAWRHADPETDTTNVVDVYVAYLRRKLDAAGGAPLLHTVRGIGYMVKPPD